MVKKLIGNLKHILGFGSSGANKNVVTDENGDLKVEDLPPIPVESITTPVADTTSGEIGSESTYAKADHSHPKSRLYAEAGHAHPIDTSRVAVYQGFENNGKFLKVTNGNVACESVTIPSAYTHPTYTARTGKPTGNQTPSFGGTFTVSQITSDGTGHVTGATDRTVTIPSLPTASTSQAGIIQIGTGANNASAGNHTHTSSQITDLMSKVYPVGAVYISVNDTDPATLFGGTWQRLQDTFLYATSGTADTGYQATAGEATHTLTTNEIPAHTHNIGSLSRYTASGKAGAAVGDGNGNTLNYHTSSTGSGAAHNNMPPYMKVYMWKRTAL